MKRRLLVFCGSLAFTGLFFILPPNRVWLVDKLLPYGNDFRNQQNNLGLEHRKIKRWDAGYVRSKAIAEFFKTKGIEKDVLVLLPPSNYLKAHGIAYHVPEPAVFYYYTGLKTVWANSPEAVEAGWYIHVMDGKLVVDSVADQKALQDTIAAFKRFGVTL